MTHKNINEHIKVFQKLQEDLIPLSIGKALIKETLKNGGTIFVAGNGGSCATASHLTGEIIGKFMTTRRGYPSVDLTANNTVLTAIGNDFSFDEIFSRQLEAMASEKDLFIGFSTSGNSKNLLLGAQVAKDKFMRTLMITGETGGQLAIDFTDANFIKVPSNNTPTIQVLHDFIMHELAHAVDEFHTKTQNEA